MALQIITSPKYVIDPQMEILLNMTNYVFSRIKQQLKEGLK